MRVPTRSAGATVMVAAVLAGAVTAGIGTAAASNGDDEGRIKNVIYLLGDGMGRTHVTAARRALLRGRRAR